MRVTIGRAVLASLAFIALQLIHGAAIAGFVPGSVNIGFTPPGPPPWAGTGGPPPFVFEIVPGNSSLATMEITETLGGLEPLSLNISGLTTDDPTIEITKEITNDTGLAWIGYEIGLNGGSNTFVAGMSSSDTMTLASESNNLLVFSQPDPVGVGETVAFTFSILIPSTGPFEFDLSQTAIPVPEPGSLVLLAVGALVLGSRRRGRAC